MNDPHAPRNQPPSIEFEGRTFTLRQPWQRLPDPEKPSAPLEDSPFSAGPFYATDGVAPEDWAFTPDAAFLGGITAAPSSMHCIQQRERVETPRPNFAEPERAG